MWLALNKACSPFSAACSSSLRFSSGLRFPSLSAVWIWSKTAFNSIADRTVETLRSTSEYRWFHRRVWGRTSR